MNLWRKLGVILLIGLSILLKKEGIYAENLSVKQEMSGYKEEIVESILEEMNLEQMEEWADETLPSKMSFLDLVESLMQGDEWDIKSLFSYMADILFYEIKNARPMFLQIISTSLLFAVFSRMIASKQDYINEIGYFVVYGAVILLLLKCFSLVSETLELGAERILSFMSAFVPVYATTLLFTGNKCSAGFFYELVFLLIFLVEYGLQKIFLPGIHIYVLLQMTDHLFSEPKLSGLCDLLEQGMKLLLKIAMTFIAGLGVVQSLIAPVKDRLSTNGVWSALSALPGIGNGVDATGELLLGCGMLIKNSIGVVALFLLFFVCLLPIVKVTCFQVMYRLSGALLEPFCDKRLGECVHSFGTACSICLKIMVDLMLLFLLTVSLITASTSFIY